jgi:hypothetical protein
MASTDLSQTARPVIGITDEAVYVGLQPDNRGEDAALEPLPGELSKATFDRVGPKNTRFA